MTRLRCRKARQAGAHLPGDPEQEQVADKQSARDFVAAGHLLYSAFSLKPDGGLFCRYQAVGCLHRLKLYSKSGSEGLQQRSSVSTGDATFTVVAGGSTGSTPLSYQLSQAEAESVYIVGQTYGLSFDSYGPIKITANLTRSGLELIWQAGKLLSSDNANGPWAQVVGATAPYYKTPIAPGKKFYRVQL